MIALNFNIVSILAMTAVAALVVLYLAPRKPHGSPALDRGKRFGGRKPQGAGRRRNRSEIEVHRAGWTGKVGR